MIPSIFARYRARRSAPSATRSQRPLAALGLMVALVIFPPMTCAQVTVVPDNAASSFTDRVSWASGSGGTEYWLGFSTVRTMRAGTWYGQYRNDGPTLADLIAGKTGSPTDLQDDIRRALDRDNADGQSDRLVEREIAVLLRIRSGEVVDVDVVNLESGVRLEGLRLYWTGRAGGREAAEWLIRMYHGRGGPDREDLLAAIAVQDDLAAIADFLRSQLRDGRSDDVREAAAWWVSDRLGVDGVADLIRSVEHDASSDVREAAMYALSRIDDRAARVAVIRAARNGSGDVREAARYALVRWAQERSQAPSHGNSDDAEADIEVRRAALYALADSDGPETLSMMIETARSNRYSELRRAALYWLAEREEPAALDALIEMAGVDAR